jgi:uncharacterized protein involved in propanediol utilization
MPVQGKSTVTTHFGEILQGIFYDASGVLECALVTLRCPLFVASAEFIPSNDIVLQVTPAKSVKALRAARLVLDHFNIKNGGSLVLNSQIPVGIGAGSSTGDVVSSIQAVADAYSVYLTPQDIANLAVEAEYAIDPVMFEPLKTELLFAHRKGKIITHLPGTTPPLLALACIDGQPIDTLANPKPAYNKTHIAEFDTLKDKLVKAISGSNSNALAEVATRSAELNQSFLAKPNFEATIKIAEKYGAIGVSVSHSGSAVSILFDHGYAEDMAQFIEIRQVLCGTGLKILGAFRL